MKIARTKIDVYNGTLTMEFDWEITSFQVLEDKGTPSEFNSCYAIMFDFIMQQNPKGPYKEKEEKDGKGCDLMKKKMRGKTRPWEAKLINYFFRENFNPPWWWKKEVRLKIINQALVRRQPNQNRFVFFLPLFFFYT